LEASFVYERSRFDIIGNGLVSTDSKYIRTTLLGPACQRHPLSQWAALDIPAEQKKAWKAL
jgi:hypothetical protein